MSTLSPRATEVPAVFSPPPGNPRFPMFDGLRALAALGVLFGHCATWTLVAEGTSWGRLMGNLQLGVTVFFVISGFLLYRPFVAAALSGHNRPKTGGFYWRRFLRIYPGYWFALALTALLPGVVSVFTDGWWKFVLLIQNYWGFAPALAKGITPAWSLCVELSFYAILPLLAILLSRAGHGTPNRRLIADVMVIGSLGIASMLLRYIVLGRIESTGGLAGQADWVLVITLPTYFGWFAVGMLLATVSAWVEATGRNPSLVEVLSRRPTLVWIAAACVFLILNFATPPPGGAEAPAYHLLSVLVAALIVFPAAFPAPHGRGVPARFLNLGAVAWLGLISYGIYLWSKPILQALTSGGANGLQLPNTLLFVAVFLLSVAAGAFSYYVVERPFLRLKGRTFGPLASKPKSAKQ